MQEHDLALRFVVNTAGDWNITGQVCMTVLIIAAGVRRPICVNLCPACHVSRRVPTQRLFISPVASLRAVYSSWNITSVSEADTSFLSVSACVRHSPIGASFAWHASFQPLHLAHWAAVIVAAFVALECTALASFAKSIGVR